MRFVLFSELSCRLEVDMGKGLPRVLWVPLDSGRSQVLESRLGQDGVVTIINVMTVILSNQLTMFNYYVIK